jgi:hypothetical protein
MKRNSNAKYLGYGLLIGMTIASAAGIALFFLFSNGTARAMIPPEAIVMPKIVSTYTLTPTTINTETLTPIPTKTATFTSTPTYIPLFTSTASAPPLPTPTLTMGEQKAKTGELAFKGILKHSEQINLYNTSITFIASTPRESKQIGEQITGKGYGSPTLICGPLSIAILQTAGLLATDVVPFDFWLLNPFLSKDRALLNRVFPEDQYTHHVIRTAINKIDYAGFPLLPGDFLYIKDGTGGNFEHMLVVNRVDKLGRAYSVTNYYTEQGFIINETMLYDPKDPSAGIFSVWTQKPYALGGSTGFGGFELWRRRINP